MFHHTNENESHTSINQPIEHDKLTKPLKLLSKNPLQQLNPQSLNNYSNALNPPSLVNSSILNNRTNSIPLTSNAGLKNDLELKKYESSIDRDIIVAQTRLKRLNHSTTSLVSDIEVGSKNDSDIFYEASPTINQPPQVTFVDHDYTKLYQHGNQVIVNEEDDFYYPTLLSESLRPIVDVYITPHMLKPLISDDSPLDLSVVFNNQNKIITYGPLCSVLEYDPTNRNDEAILLNILSDEISKLDNEDDKDTYSSEISSKLEFTAFLKNVGKVMVRWVKGLSYDEYHSLYTWAKYVHVDDEDEEELEYEDSTYHD